MPRMRHESRERTFSAARWRGQTRRKRTEQHFTGTPALKDREVAHGRQIGASAKMGRHKYHFLGIVYPFLSWPVGYDIGSKSGNTSCHKNSRKHFHCTCFCFPPLCPCIAVPKKYHIRKKAARVDSIHFRRWTEPAHLFRSRVVCRLGRSNGRYRHDFQNYACLARNERQS